MVGKKERKELSKKSQQVLMELLGIVDEGKVVSLKDLEEREEVDICQVLLRESWNKEKNL